MRWESAANLFSNLGTWMQLTVQNLLVLQLTGSAATTTVPSTMKPVSSMSSVTSGPALSSCSPWATRSSTITTSARPGRCALRSMAITLPVRAKSPGTGLLMIMAYLYQMTGCTRIVGHERFRD